MKTFRFWPLEPGKDRKWRRIGRGNRSGEEVGWVRSYPRPSSVVMVGALWKWSSPRWCDAVMRLQGAPLGCVPEIWTVLGVWLVPGIRMVLGFMWWGVSVWLVLNSGRLSHHHLVTLLHHKKEVGLQTGTDVNRKGRKVGIYSHPGWVAGCRGQAANRWQKSEQQSEWQCFL